MARICIHVEGGLVRDVFSDVPDLEVDVFDEDAVENGDDLAREYLDARREILLEVDGKFEVRRDVFPHEVY